MRDVDFQIYTLREAVRAMPVRQVTREERIELADRIAVLGAQSDGWTAASAAATLVELGAVKYAVDVVSQIPPRIPRAPRASSNWCAGCWRQTSPNWQKSKWHKGLAWARSYPGRNPERALIGGLVEVYLAQGQPAKALSLLAGWDESGRSLASAAGS